MKLDPTTLSAYLRTLPQHNRLAFITSLLSDLDKHELDIITHHLMLSPPPVTPSAQSQPQSRTLSNGEEISDHTSDDTSTPVHLTDLPIELIINILSFLEDPYTTTSLAQTSRRMYAIVEVCDEEVWRGLCVLWGFDSGGDVEEGSGAEKDDDELPLREMEKFADLQLDPALEWITARKREQLASCKASSSSNGLTRSSSENTSEEERRRPDKYKKRFRRAYLIQKNWKQGGTILRCHVPSHSDFNQEPPIPSAVVTCMALSDTWLVVALANSQVHIYSAKSGVLSRTLVGHEAGVWCVWLINAGGEDRTRDDEDQHGPEDEETDDDKARLSRLGSYLKRAVGLSTDGHAKSSSGDSDSPAPSGGQGVKPYDSTEEEPETFDEEIHHEERDADEESTNRKCSTSAGWGQPNVLVISAGCDKVVKVWDVRSGYCIHTLHSHPSTIRCLAALPYTPLAVTGSRDGAAIVWDIRTGRQLRVLSGHTKSIRCVEVGWLPRPSLGEEERGTSSSKSKTQRGRKRAVTASYDETCRVWDIDTGECLHILNGHHGEIYVLAFDSVNARIASAGTDTTIRLWDAITGQCLALLSGHTSFICSLHLTSTRVISGSADGRIVAFPIPHINSPIGSGSSPPIYNASNMSSSSSSSSTIPSPNISLSLGLSSSIIPTTVTKSSPDLPQAPYSKLFSAAVHRSSVTSIQWGGTKSFQFLVSSGVDGRVRVWEILSPSTPGAGSTRGHLISGVDADAYDAAGPSQSQKPYHWVRDLVPNPLKDGLGSTPRKGHQQREDGERECVWKVVWRGGVCAVAGRTNDKSVVEIWSFREEDQPKS